MKTSSNQTVFSNSCEMDTLGIVVDLHDEGGRNLAYETVRSTGDIELRNLVSMVQTFGNRYLVVAGRFDGTGIIGAVCDDNENLISAFRMTNARMNEIGSRTTGWMIKPDACANLLGKVSLQSSQKGDV